MGIILFRLSEFQKKIVILQSKSKESIMEIYFTGMIIAVSTFLIIGLFHPVVIKAEYYLGTRCWWAFLLLGLVTIGCAFFIADVLWSAIIGVVGASLLWSIGEIFAQKKRVEKGWFPMNPKRRHEYNITNEKKDENELDSGRKNDE